MTKLTRRRRNVKKARKTRVKRRPKRGGNIPFDKVKFGEFITNCGDSCYDENDDDFKYLLEIANNILIYVSRLIHYRSGWLSVFPILKLQRQKKQQWAIALSTIY